MKIHRPTVTAGNRCADQAGFTIIEVVVAGAIAALLVAGMFKGFTQVGERAQLSACNLAANAEARRKIEQVISANWIPTYGELDLFSSTLTAVQTGNLCLPSADGSVVNYTNYTSITQISTNPPYAMIQVQCVWGFGFLGTTYTNTVAVLRAPNE